MQQPPLPLPQGLYPQPMPMPGQSYPPQPPQYYQQPGQPQYPQAYPPQYPYGPPQTNPTQYTEVSMDYLNTQMQPPRPIETLQFLPTGFQKCLMAPFPFCCAGCCVSKLTRMQFNNENKILTLTLQSGYCCLCAETKSIPYSEIMESKIETDPVCRNGKRGAYKTFLILETKMGDFQLTSSKVKSETQAQKTIADRFMKRCGIRIK